MPLSQAQLIEVMTALGYDTNQNGMCYGIVAMAIQSVLASDPEKFNYRLEELAARLQKQSAVDVAKDIADVEQRRVQFVLQYRKDALKALGKDENMSDEKFHQLLKNEQDKKPMHSSIKLFLEKRKNFEKSLTQNERELSEMRAFFEGIALYFSPSKYPNLFEKGTVPYTQNIVETMPRVLSHDLVEMVEDKDAKLAKPRRITPKKEQALVDRVIEPFSGLYHLQELEKLFDMLGENATFDPPATIMLNTINHSIVVFYDPNIKTWMLLDPNSMPMKSFKGNNEISRAVFASYAEKENKFVVLSAEIFSTKNQLVEIRQSLNEKMQSETWQQIHDVKGKENMSDPHGASLLHIAAEVGDEKMMRKLLDNKPENIDDPSGKKILSPLAKAILGGHKNICQMLLDNKNPAINVNYQDEQKNTAIHYAAFRGDLASITALVEKKADIHQRNFEGMNALFVAAFGGHHDVVKELLKHGATFDGTLSADPKDVLKQMKEANWTKRDKIDALFKEKYPGADAKLTGFTPLHAAVAFGHVDMVKTLIEKSADVEAKTDRDMSVRDLALATGNAEILGLLSRGKTYQMVKEKEASEPVQEQTASAQIADKKPPGHTLK